MNSKKYWRSTITALTVLSGLTLAGCAMIEDTVSAVTSSTSNAAIKSTDGALSIVKQ